jgi:excinuclease UvrABC ATPase subunit
MDRTQTPHRPFNSKRPGGLVDIIMTVSEHLGALYGSIAETRAAGTYGRCAECGGTVQLAKIDPGRMIAPELSLKNGAVLLWAGTVCAPVPRIRQLAAMLGIDYLKPLKEQDPEFISVLLYGYEKEPVAYVYKKNPRTDYYRGCVHDLQAMIDARTTSKGNLRMISFFSKRIDCPACQGTGLNSTVSGIELAGLRLSEAEKLPIPELYAFIQSLPQLMEANEYVIASPIISQLEQMLNYLDIIGLRALNPAIGQPL